MSPHAVNSFVTDLVAMAQAMERVPLLEQSLERAREQNSKANDAILERDRDLEQSRTYAASLEVRLHDAEVAKDQAETMFLEADERTSRALDFIKATFGNAGTLIQALEPAKPAPQADSPSDTLTRQAEAHIADHGEGVISPAAQLDSHPVSETKPDWAQDKAETSLFPPQGQREPDPTMNATHGEQKSEQTSVISSASTAATLAEAQTGPYHGHNYYDWPSYVEFDRWIAGGGTEWDYYNRRTA